MTKSIERRVKKLEDSLNVNQGKRRVAMVVYDPDICPQSNLPSIEAEVLHIRTHRKHLNRFSL